MSPVVPREGRNLRSVNGVWVTVLDSSLRCAAFRMTGGRDGALRMAGKGRCDQNDGINMRCVRNDGINMRRVRDDRINLLFRYRTLCVSDFNRT